MEKLILVLKTFVYVYYHTWNRFIYMRNLWFDMSCYPLENFLTHHLHLSSHFFLYLSFINYIVVLIVVIVKSCLFFTLPWTLISPFTILNFQISLFNIDLKRQISRLLSSPPHLSLSIELISKNSSFKLLTSIMISNLLILIVVLIHSSSRKRCISIIFRGRFWQFRFFNEISWTTHI